MALPESCLHILSEVLSEGLAQEISAVLRLKPKDPQAERDLVQELAQRGGGVYAVYDACSQLQGMSEMIFMTFCKEIATLLQREHPLQVSPLWHPFSTTAQPRVANACT
jgi:hypothetical protein